MTNLIFLSTNIRYENPRDGKHDWPHRADFLCELINQHAPSVLASQEGRRPQLMDFQSRLKDLEMIQSHRDWIPERMYPGLYVDFSKVTVIESGDFWLSLTPHVSGTKSFGSTFPRLCVWAHLKFSTGLELIVANSHFDHILESTRIGQSGVLKKELLALKEKKGIDVVLMGDFNEDPKHAFKESICETLSLIDPWEKLGLAEEPSHHNFLGNIQSDGHRIDWILTPQDFTIDKIELLKDKSPDGIYPSDHYPLLLSCYAHPKL